MPNNLGRDELWDPQVWGEIDKAILAEVGRIRVAQKIFPSSPSDRTFLHLRQEHSSGRWVVCASSISRA